METVEREETEDTVERMAAKEESGTEKKEIRKTRKRKHIAGGKTKSDDQLNRERTERKERKKN